MDIWEICEVIVVFLNFDFNVEVYNIIFEMLVRIFELIFVILIIGVLFFLVSNVEEIIFLVLLEFDMKIMMFLLLIKDVFINWLCDLFCVI